MSNSLDKLRQLSTQLQEKIDQKENLFTLDEKHETPKPVKPKSTLKESTPNMTRMSVPPVASKPPKTNVVISEDSVRDKNIIRIKTLYEKLEIYEKSPDFEQLFDYKAMNLSGIGLKEDDFGEPRKGKYIQVIAITYEIGSNGKKKAKNVSLGYFGKAEQLEETLKNDIVEFVLRWRYEKAFQNLVHYRDLIERVDVMQENLLF
jgi:hypothetical protein